MVVIEIDNLKAPTLLDMPISPLKLDDGPTFWKPTKYFEIMCLVMVFALFGI
jgi:hypothetical protein